VLVCNAPDAAQRLLDGLGPATLDPGRAQRMRPHARAAGTDYRAAAETLSRATGEGILA